MSRCRSCQAPMLWARTEKGHRIPLDPEPVAGDDVDPRGRFVLRYPDGYALAVAVPPEAFPDEPQYRSHFATCPNADQHRRSR